MAVGYWYDTTIFSFGVSWQLGVSEAVLKGQFLTTGCCLFFTKFVFVANPFDCGRWVCNVKMRVLKVYLGDIDR